MSERKAIVNVVPVLGMSYCGSTVFNYMMDSHSAVYGGGELHWLTHADKSDLDWTVECTTCRERCPLWTKERIDAMSAAGFYAAVSELMEADIIVDTSKDPGWFKRIIDPSLNPDCRFLPVVLTKHPVRHLSSFVCARDEWHDLFPSDGRPGLFKARKRRRILEELIDYMEAFYEQVFEFLADIESLEQYRILRYEDVVTDPENALVPLLEGLGIGYQAGMSDCFAGVHHQIGGNAGPIYQAVNRWPSERDRIHEVRRDQYESKRELFVDQKFRQIFTRDEIRWCRERPAVRELSSRLHYVDEDIAA